MRAHRTPPVCGNRPRTNQQTAKVPGPRLLSRGTIDDNRKSRGSCAMIRNLGCALMLATFFFVDTTHAQQLDTSMSHKQIIASILKECHELYARSVGECACAPDRNKEGARSNKVVKDLPESFKPFCTRKDVTL